MKKLIRLTALLLVITSLLAFDFPGLNKPGKKTVEGKEIPLITLTKSNTVVFRGAVTGESVTEVQKKIFKLSSANKFQDTIYLVLDTPGGDVVSGQEFITSLKALPQEIKTITNFAASMGFIMAQSLGERLILPHGTLMSHRARGSVSGQIPGELNSRVEYWTRRMENIEKECADRMKLSVNDYKNLIVNEYWVDGQDAVNANAADKVVLAKCDSSMITGTNIETVRTLFGSVRVTWSDCPLITYPLDVDFSRIFDYTSTADRKMVQDVIHTMIYKKQEFIHKYLNTGIYLNYVK